MKYCFQVNNYKHSDHVLNTKYTVHTQILSAFTKQQQYIKTNTYLFVVTFYAFRQFNRIITIQQNWSLHWSLEIHCCGYLPTNIKRDYFWITHCFELFMLVLSSLNREYWQSTVLNFSLFFAMEFLKTKVYFTAFYIFGRTVPFIVQSMLFHDKTFPSIAMEELRKCTR
jgi:hypothetical protein